MPDTTTLDYALSTDPNPVVVSGSDHDSYATLTFVVSNPLHVQTSVQSIAFQFSIGPNANNLTTQSMDGIDVAMPEGWSSSIQASTITFTPSSGDLTITGDGLTFAFQILINNEVGTTPVTVTETMSGAENAHDVEFDVAKFPLGFTVEPLTAAPMVLAGPGLSTTLDWAVYGGADATNDGSAYDCVLSSETQTSSNDETVGTNGPYPIDALNESTLFTLTVSGTDSFGNQFSNASSVYVTVGSPLVTSFTAADGTQCIAVDVDEPAMLAWTTQNANKVIIKPTDGLSVVLDDPLNTDGYGIVVDTSTSLWLSAEYSLSDPPTSEQFPEPVNVTINPPEMLTLDIGSNADGNFVDASYFLTFTAKNANYVCLSASPEQEFDTVWFPVDGGGPIDIPTPATNGVVYTLTPYRLDDGDVALLESGAVPKSARVTDTQDAAPAPIPMSATLNFEMPGVYFMQTQIVPDGVQTHTFSPGRPISSHMLSINGFYFIYRNDEHHHISSLGAKIAEESHTSDTVYVHINQFLEDDSYNTLSTDSYVNVQLIYTDDTDPKALAFHTGTTQNPTIMSEPEVHNAITGIYDFYWSTDDGDQKISEIKLSSGDRSVSNGNEVTVSGETFTLKHNDKTFGSNTFEWSIVAQNGTKPTGLVVKYYGPVNSGTKTAVSGGHPIDSIAILPTYFKFDDGKNDHDFCALKLDFTISGEPGDDTFYFTPTCRWYKDSDDYYSTSANFMVIIKYAVPE